MEIRREVDEVENIDLDRFDKWRNKIGINRSVEEEFTEAIRTIYAVGTYPYAMAERTKTGFGRPRPFTWVTFSYQTVKRLKERGLMNNPTASGGVSMAGLGGESPPQAAGYETQTR